MYRRMIKPYQAEVIAAIKRRSNARVFFHSCGNVYPLIADFIEIGVDVLNPVQVSAGEMGDTARLKREFGDRITFCGGVDTQWVLPHGTAGRCARRGAPAHPRPGAGRRVYPLRGALHPAGRAAGKRAGDVRRPVPAGPLTRLPDLSC